MPSNRAGDNPNSIDPYASNIDGFWFFARGPYPEPK